MSEKVEKSKKNGAKKELEDELDIEEKKDSADIKLMDSL